MNGHLRDPLPSGTRREILEQLAWGAASAAELADSLGISSAAVRQHLGRLLGEGLVVRRKRTPTAGRPAYAYRLSDLGQSAFPKRYDVLLAEIVEALLERRGREEALAVVEEAAERFARRLEGKFAEPSGPEGWGEIYGWLEEEFQWRAAFREEDGTRRLVLHHCPFAAVSTDHPVVCGRFFTVLLRSLTGERIRHVAIRDGVRCCALELERR